MLREKEPEAGLAGRLQRSLPPKLSRYPFLWEIFLGVVSWRVFTSESPTILSERHSSYIDAEQVHLPTSVIFDEPEHDDGLGGIELAVEVEVEQIEKVFHFQSSGNLPVHRQHGEHLN